MCVGSHCGCVPGRSFKVSFSSPFPYCSSVSQSLCQWFRNSQRQGILQWWEYYWICLVFNRGSDFFLNFFFLLQEASLGSTKQTNSYTTKFVWCEKLKWSVDEDDEIFSTFTWTPNPRLALQATLLPWESVCMPCVAHRKALANTTTLLTLFKALSILFTFILSHHH